MLNPLNFISKFFTSSNQKELNKLQKIVKQVNDKENQMIALENSEFPKKTEELKNRIKQGSKIDDLIPEAFALVREASKRTRGERHFDVQIIGGIVLHQGKLLR